MKFATIVVATPQLIKCAPLSREKRKEHQECIIYTCQHYNYNISKVLFDELIIPEPDYNLNLGSGSQGPQIGALLAVIEDVFIKEHPNLMGVFWDTNSTLAAPLDATKLGIPVIHIEAGTHSFDHIMPEEINWVLTDQILTLLFSPTLSAVHNIGKEENHNGVHKIGDVMVDSLNSVKNAALKKIDVLSRLSLKRHDLYTLTINCSGNTNFSAKLAKILRAIGRVGTPRSFQLILEYSIFRTRPILWMDYLITL